ncbi:unnamed protein product [Cyprideis torosa]|uniref:Uncharacterized protein n=1 Tax=Cyprideis torosa TaxID=163714 RepID=A0A7R8WJM0_9CRUS|nr:unnamed protein product [Cyprideis torosa]CAG0895868.1 unnamed protein product [Cyprideis torosa]
MTTVTPEDFFDAEERNDADLFTSAREELPSNNRNLETRKEIRTSDPLARPAEDSPPMEDIDLGGSSPLEPLEKNDPLPPVVEEAKVKPSPSPRGMKTQPVPSSISGGDGNPFTEPEQTENVREQQDPAENKETMDEEARDQFLEISVLDPEKVGDGMSSYMSYRVRTRTNIPYFKCRNQETEVWRRFSDFLGLHDKLQEKYLHSGRIIPRAPEKNVLGTTKVKMSSGATSGGGNSETASVGSDGGSTVASPTDEFLEKRRASLERYLNRTAAHPVLRQDPDFRDFLMQEGELPRATQTSALSGAGVLRLFSRMGETMNKMTVKIEENDPWFEEKTQQIESMEIQLRKLHTSVDALSQLRKDLALNTASFARATAILSNCEEHTSLARALSQFSELEEKLEQIYAAQSTADAVVLAETLKDYVGLLGSVKAALHERIKAYQLWQHAQQTLVRKREAKAKYELAQRSDKIPQAKEEVTEWEAKVERSQEAFEAISRTIKREMEGFDKTRVTDFRDTIVKYLEILMEHQQEIIRHWEAFLPEAQAIVQ